MAKKTKASKKTGPLKLAGTDAKLRAKKWDVEKIWSKKLGKQFTPISTYFLKNYHRLKYPITPTELTVIVHLFSHKWDEAMPFPAVGTIAKRMGRSEQAVRTAMRSLERSGYLRRHITRGKPNHFDLEPLIDKMHELFDADVVEKASRQTRRKRNSA